jgi:hypothetical protein
MGPPPARLHKNSKELRYIIARASTPRPRLGTDPFLLLRPRPARALLSSLVLAQPSPTLALRLFVILVSRLPPIAVPSCLSDQPPSSLGIPK